MGGTKRRRGVTKAAAAAASSETTSSSVLEVWNHIQEISKSSERSDAILQGFCDGNCYMATPKKNQVPVMDCYWIVVGTHILNRLLQSASPPMSLVAAFGDALSTILMADKQKLERASHVAASRSIMARAMLTATVAASHCLEQYEDGSNLTTDALQACVATLDRVVFLKSIAAKETLPIWEQDDVHLKLSDAEEACISFLVSNTGDQRLSVSPPSKRSTRRKTAPSTSASSSSPIDTDMWFKAFSDLQETESFHGQRVDGRVAIKRWASMALVWLYQGQLLLLQVTHKLAQDSMDCSKKSEWMNTLVQVVCEAGSHCGLRPPSGGMDQYLKVIHPNMTTTTTSSSPTRSPSTSPSTSNKDSKNKKKAKPQRADIRDWAVAAIYDLLEVHQECLSNITTTSLLGAALVNDQDIEDGDGGEDDGDGDGSKEEKKQASLIEGAIFTAPELASTLQNLCRVAANSVHAADFGDQAEWTKCLMALAVACALRVTANLELPLDCKLANFAVTKLAESLQVLETQPTSTLSSDTNLEDLFGLTQPFPEPDIKQIETDYTSSGRTCSYAGLGDTIVFLGFTDEHAVAIAMRAIWTAAGGSSATNTTAAAQLVATLTSIVERMYDTRTSATADRKKDAEVEEQSMPSQKSKKRGAKGKSRKSKRMKTEHGTAISVVETVQHISAPRAMVATQALNALKLCLLNQAYPQSPLRQSIRTALGSKHYLKLIELGEGLDRVLLKTKEPTKLDGDNFEAFIQYEKQLWTAHMGMCQYLGRGRTFDNSFMVDPILGTTSQRKSLYQGLAKSHKSPDGMEWSLSLPAAHHAVLVANFTSERKATTRAFTVPELYITREYVKSIHHTLRNIQVLTATEWEDHYLYVDTEIPLSYNDARTFVLAFCRLLKDDQRACLEDLVTQTCNALESMKTNTAKRSGLAHSSEASGFVARVFVVCGCLIDIVTIGSRLEKAYFTSGGARAQIKLPSFVTTMDWYRCDRCFMGMFDWESPALPDSTLPAPALNGLKETTTKEFRTALEIGFELGFDSAHRDKCHLLFAAWNVLDKIHTIDDGRSGSSPRAGAFPLLQTSAKDNFSGRLLELREDVCTIHADLTEGTNSRVSPSRLKSNLRSMMSRANGLLDSLLSDHVPEDDDMTQEIPIAVFALLEALPAYISACIAGHTKPGNDYFSASLSKGGINRARRQRGYSSESEQALSDADSDTDGGEYDADTRAETLSRLRECCHAFGAAPIHPDWLDVSSSLRDGVRYSDAVEVAEEALQTLTKLMTTAFVQYKRHCANAIKGYCQASDRNIEERVNLCLNLCQWSNHEPAASSMLGPGQYQDERDWKEDIAAVCELPQEIVELFLEESCVKNLEQARESWCPNAAQRLIGKLQDRVLDGDGSWEASTAELRAGGEWELMLAQAVAVSCVDVKYGSPYLSDSSRTDFSGQPGHKDMVTAQLWQSVLANAISHLMPAAALLRVGLGKGGRKPHPFCFHEKNQDPYEVAPLHFSEHLPQAVKVTLSQKNAVLDTISVVSRICAEGEDILASQCHAVAAHLVADTNSFSDLEGMQCIRSAVIALKRIRELADTCSKKDERLKIFPFVVERLTSVIEDFSRPAVNDDSAGVNSPEEFRRLLAFFGTTNTCDVNTIVQNSLGALGILGQADRLGLDEEKGSIYWSQKDLQLVGINMFVSALCKDTLGANDKTRACFAMLLRKVTSLDFGPRLQSVQNAPQLIVPVLIKAFNEVGEQSLKALVLHDFCCLTPEMKIADEPSGSFREDLGTIFSFLLLSKRGQDAFDRSRSILEILIGSFDSWSNLKHADREPILETLFLYGCRFNSLQEIGSKLVARVSSACDEGEDLINTMDEVELLTKLFGYIRDFRGSLSVSPAEKKTTSSTSRKASKNASKQGKDEATGASGDGVTLPRSCSYVQKSGFHSQHWYNCYTCGLVWDKGCCTLCALVCHKDHDVSYSRCSSFFCDCGAENSNAAEQNRVPCKCLSPLSTEDAERVLRNDGNPLEPSSSKSEGEEIDCSLNTSQFASSISIEIARESFKSTALSSIQSFTENIKDTSWRDAVFQILRKQFQLWTQKKSLKSSLESLVLETGTASELQPIVRVSHLAQRRSLRMRRGKALDLENLSRKTLVAVRAAKEFQARISSDSSANSHLVSKLALREISRSILVADSRGRMILAEPCSLIFYSAVPAVSVRYVSMPYDAHLIRKQMCILGTASIKFNIVGMQLCAENESHLVVWGTAEACVVVLKPDWTGIEENIDLVFDVGQHDSDGDYLVKCEWIPGSQTNVVVGCSRFVRIYDVTRSKSDKRALPIIGYNLGFEACLRDVTIVPFKGYDSVDDRIDEKSNISKMFLLLENGRLHVVDLKTGANGRLESPGDQQHFEPSECISLSMGGVRARAGSSVGPHGSSTRTLGEGSRLAYLKQSRVLLYKCASSCVLALMLDKIGDVEGTFEFLPHTIPSKVLGDASDGHAISGPYTHWTELGVAYHHGAAFFRVACVGRCLRSSEPKLLCIEFNESEVKIREVAWSANSAMGLGLSMINSYEGLAAFSVPFLGDAANEGPMYGERAFLCALTSNGTMLFFGEELVDTLPPKESEDASRSLSIVDVSDLEYEAQRVKKPVFPLTIFERLKNIGDTDIVVLGGDGIGSDMDEAKARLSRDSGSSFICPSREGCTITISLRQGENKPGESATQSTSRSKHDGNELVIAAVRILVGSTFNNIPSKVCIQGRPVDLTPRAKKWYCLPLTNEEIALSVRNGLVSVEIGPSFDSTSNVVIDAMEVYGVERSSVDKYLPKAYFTAGDTAQTTISPIPHLRTSLEVDSAESVGLILSCRALSFLCELVGSKRLISDGERDFLRQLVQETALDRDKKVRECVQALLERLEPNDRSRTSFHDESLLFGCSKALGSTKEILSELSMHDDEESASGSKWGAIGCVLRDCLQAASSIARVRPMNYLQSMENIVENDLSSSSLAVDASNVILEGFRKEAQYGDLLSGCTGIIDLSLTEMAIELNTDAPHSKQFANFEVIRGFLELDDVNMVQRSCDAISSFCRRHGGADNSNNSTPDLFTLLQHARRVAYQCDSCALFPLKEIRYTLLEGDHDIDLCKKCYSLGTKFAEKERFDANVDVVINGKSVGAETKLTCAHMRQMQPVSLEKMDVEQVEVQSAGRRGASSSGASMDEDEELQKALRLSLGENTVDEPGATIGYQAYEDFVGYLFSSTVDLVATVLKREGCGSRVAPLIRLLLDLVQLSRQGDSKNDRAKRFAKELSHGISYILKSGGQKLSPDNSLTLVTCLRAFSNLLAPETDSQYYLAGSQPDEHGDENRATRQKEKTNPNFVCEVHNIPAVRRRCARGAHKDRRFYVCGKERGARCKYFVWADQASTKAVDKPIVRSPFRDIVQGYLWNHSSSSGMPLQARLCQLLEEELLGGESDDFDGTMALGSASSGKKSEGSSIKSIYNGKKKERDFSDGVFCSREKLQDIVSGESVLMTEREGSRDLSMPVRVSGDRGVQLLEASLDVLILIADHESDGISRWFSLLCEINVSTSKHAGLRALAKKVLKSLCGGKQTLYHSVRDHFAFWFQLKRLYRNASQLMDAALIVKEKARNCRPDWSSSERITWSNLGVGDLIGTDELISEDEYTQLCSKMIGKVLDELWAAIKNRGESWRRFCSLRSLPHSQRDQKGSGRDSADGEGEEHLPASAPIVALFWISCSLAGTNQGKILRLVDFALTKWKERPSGMDKLLEPGAEEAVQDGPEEEETMLLSQEALTIPEDILLSSDRKLTVDGIIAFAIALVYGGRTLQLRQLSLSIVMKLCHKFSSADLGLIFQRLVSFPFDDVGRMGKMSTEFLSLLQSLSRFLDSSVPVRDATALVMGCFEQQMDAVRYDRSNGEWVVLESASGSSTAKKRFDISCCQHCQRHNHHSGTKESAPKNSERRDNVGSSSRSSRSGASGSNSTFQNRASSQLQARPQNQRKWHHDQVCGYSRGRLDNSKETSASDEFCSFYMLKYRLSISDFHLATNEPRGRYVKTINIYFSPRPVGDVSTLKSEDYIPQWQKCATINLSRGASRANATLAQPVVAANLKIEYAEFYERPGGSKASDGSMLVHCPRCTRVVTNAHGVCGNCGEVAFQCRKCRHINYDRLDAFLCVECGYCASGSFSYELTAGVASNAVTITNDEDHNRCVKMLGAATSIQTELRSSLRQKISTTGVKKKSGVKKDDPDAGFSPAMKRAFLGLPPALTAGKDRKSILDRVEKQGSVVRFVARPDISHSGSRSSNAADRTRSLLRIARQIRSESGTASERRRSSDVIIRHLGRGLAIDHMEDENNILGLLEGGSDLDSPDPLSRAMAARRRGDLGASGQGGNSNQRTGEGASSGLLQKKKETGKEAMEEFQRLNLLMREADRESYELNRRLQAWNRLNSGSITYTGTDAIADTNFTPSHCSNCAVTVAHQLLLLWLRLFQSRPSDMDIDREFLCTLLEDVPGVGKGFVECKRLVVREIATKSDAGAKLVLVELRKRLTATRDVTCAEILGKIMEVDDFSMSEDYSKLAMDVLAG